jgi:fatty acid desaturase
MPASARDYSLIGRDAQLAEANGFAAAEWYSCSIPRKELKELMKRSDGPALRDTATWLSCLALSAAGGVYFWGTWWAVPFFVVYGVLYGSSSDSRWHETGHGTAFKTRWMNDILYYVASFMILREPTVWRWSHTRHHTDTIIVGRDPEIAVPRPPDGLGLLLNIFALKSSYHAFRALVIHAAGRLTKEEETFIPEMERWKVYLVARIYLAIFVAVAAICFYQGSILPAMLIGLPTLYGGFMAIFFGLTQHTGLAEDVLDHRLNTRTVYMNPVFRFLYWNMNYHIEHHMFPMVPYHALPRLHELIKDDCPPAYNSTIAAYREIIPTVLRQIKDPAFFVARELPDRTKQAPYNHGSVVKIADHKTAGSAV